MSVHKLHVINAATLLFLGFWEYFHLFSPTSFLFIGIGVVLLSFSNGILYGNKSLVRMSSMINFLGIIAVLVVFYNIFSDLNILRLTRFTIALVMMTTAAVFYLRVLKK